MNKVLFEQSRTKAGPSWLGFSLVKVEPTSIILDQIELADRYKLHSSLAKKYESIHWTIESIKSLL